MLRQASPGVPLPIFKHASSLAECWNSLQQPVQHLGSCLQEAFTALLRDSCEELASAKPILARARDLGSTSIALLHARRCRCLDTMSALRERLLIYAENHLTTADELRLESGCEALVSFSSSPITQHRLTS
jgi:hypothetical protein